MTFDREPDLDNANVGMTAFYIWMYFRVEVSEIGNFYFFVSSEISSESERVLCICLLQ